MTSASISLFGKSARTKSLAPRLGRDDAAFARRLENEGVMGRTTTPRRRSTFVAQTNGGAAHRTYGAVTSSAGMTEEEAARKFSALVIPYSKGDLATAACRTKEAAKHWKDGSRAPNSSSLINIGRRIPRVRDWVLAEMDVALPASETSNPDADEIAALQLAANFPGQLGAVAKMLLKQKLGGN